MDFRVISIGAMSAHEWWGEKFEMRTAHATCVLIRTGDKTILVNPGLPEPAMIARLHERSGIKPEAITDIFLTDFKPDRRLGITGFMDANWWIGEQERESVGLQLIQKLQDVQGDEEMETLFKREISILQKCKACPDTLAPNVDLFPVYGVTPGSCALLLKLPRHTVVIAGGAVASIEHLDRGKVVSKCVDLEMARASFQEILEIADWIIPGHDNIVPNPSRGLF